MVLLQWPLLLVSNIEQDDYEKHRLGQLIEELKNKEVAYVHTEKLERVLDLCSTKRDIAGVFIDWYVEEDINKKVDVVLNLRQKFSDLPIFILAEKIQSEVLPTEVLAALTGFYFLDEDTLPFIAGRLKRFISDYVKKLYPPFFEALQKYVENYKYAWHTPGHMGGEGFLKSPTGQAFYHFFGENIMRADLSVSVPELGSLLDHSGVVKEAEKLAEKTFLSDLTYFILNGTSTANQVIWHSQVSTNDIALVDRNCHKSLNYAMVITGAIPMYMKPRRNGIGIIGPVRLSEFSKAKGDLKKKENPLLSEQQRQLSFKMSALTNSTYDGLCYNVPLIKNTLENHVEYLHFDEAWYAYAAFHPIYKNFFGMTEDIQASNHPPVFCTQSTHKLLTAFSQASMIHVRHGGTEKIVHDEFNEAYMMHGSTSPNYPMIASLDISTQMMNRDGKQMSNDNILSAVELRQRIQKIHNEYKTKGDWFFKMWQPETLEDGTDFCNANPNSLINNQSVWILSAKDKWHGFDDIEDNFILLDPIKLTFLTPGVDKNGDYLDNGIPAGIVTDYLINKGIVVEKTDTYSFLMLHSFGTTRGKHGELLSTLIDFKSDYDRNTSLKEVFPNLLKEDDDYKTMGLRDLCDKMHNFFKEKDFLKVMHNAFEKLPKQVMKPADAYEALVRKQVEYVHLNEMMNRIPAVMLVPYPPGIPVMMGGELLNEEAKNIFSFLQTLQEFENTFKGYEKDIHGVERDVINGKIYYKTLCLKK